MAHVRSGDIAPGWSLFVKVGKTVSGWMVVTLSCVISVLIGQDSYAQSKVAVEMRHKSAAQIRGRVTEATDGSPLRDIELRLIARFEAPNAYLETTVTDSDGQYHFRFSGNDAYTITVSGEGFVKTLYESASTPSGISQQRDDATSLPRLEFSLVRAAVVRGMVVDANGKAIGPGIRVTASGGDNRIPGASPVDANGITDAEGHFALKGLPPGSYCVCRDYTLTSPSGSIMVGKPGEYQETWSGPSLSAERNLQLNAGQEVNDIRITVGPATHYNLVVWPTGPEGYPVPAYYQVELYGWTAAQKQSDGSYLIPGVPTGLYALITTAWLEGNPWVEGQEETKVEVSNADLTMHVDVGGVGAIRGVVRWEGVPGMLNSSMRIGYEALEGHGGGSIQPDPDGSFSLKRVLPGRYLLRLDNKPPGAVWQSVQCNGADVTLFAPLLVDAGQQITTCEVVLKEAR
jgi:hypothetical protein